MFSKRRRLSSEHTMLSILEYLYYNSQKTPVTKFNIVTHTPGIKRQRPDRVNLMIASLQINGFTMAVKSSNFTSYKITDKGIVEYTKWIKNFLEFARAAHDDWFV
jgi:predicted transcriptional regulator